MRQSVVGDSGGYWEEHVILGDSMELNAVWTQNSSIKRRRRPHRAVARGWPPGDPCVQILDRGAERKPVKTSRARRSDDLACASRS